MPVFDPTVFDSAVFDAGIVVFRDARIAVEARGSVVRDARIPIEAGGTVEVFRDAQLPIDARGSVVRDARLNFEVRSSLFRDARIPIEARFHDEPIQRYAWRVLQPANAVQVYAWKVLEVSIIGGEQVYRWRVFAEPPTQGYTWTVIPAELLELFESQGQGAAAGIAPDTLLPVGRVTKE